MGSMSDITMLFDIIILGCGLYVLYSAYKMKTTGEAEGNPLLNKNLNWKKCKDKAGFIGALLPIMWVMGVLFVVDGGLNLYIDNGGAMPNVVKYGLMVIAFVFLITYMIIYKNAEKKYFD